MLTKANIPNTAWLLLMQMNVTVTVLKQLQVVDSYSQIQTIHLGKPQLATLHQMYVRSILEYSSVVQAPYTKCNIDKLEAFQMRAARFVASNYSYTSSITAMMETLNWNTLHARRYILRLIMFYKILHNMVDISLPESIITSATADYTRGHYLHLSRINAYKYSFFSAAMNL